MYDDPHRLEFMFTVGHIEVYKEINHEAYYWKFFDNDHYHGAFMSLQTCMSNYENVLINLDKSTRELGGMPVPAIVCPVIEAQKSDNNVIFVDFFRRKRSF